MVAISKEEVDGCFVPQEFVSRLYSWRRTVRLEPFGALWDEMIQPGVGVPIFQRQHWAYTGDTCASFPCLPLIAGVDHMMLLGTPGVSQEQDFSGKPNILEESLLCTDCFYLWKQSLPHQLLLDMDISRVACLHCCSTLTVVCLLEVFTSLTNSVSIEH